MIFWTLLMGNFLNWNILLTVETDSENTKKCFFAFLFWSVTLREKCPNEDLFLVRIFLPNTGKCRPKISVCGYFSPSVSFRSSREEVFICRKGVLKNFIIFTGKHLCWSLQLIKLQALKNIMKILKIHILKDSCKLQLLELLKFLKKYSLPDLGIVAWSTCLQYYVTRHTWQQFFL